MKIRSRRIIDFIIQGGLLMILVVPSLARVGVQCPFPLLTQGGSYNQNNPEISLDPNCRNVAVSNFTDICRVELNSVTGQPSGRTVLPRFGNSSSILLFANATTAAAIFHNATTLARFNRCFVNPLPTPPAYCTFSNGTTHVRCRSITCGDGHVLMGDRDRTQNADLIGDGDTYIFGFKDVTGVPPDQILAAGFAKAQHVAPTMLADQGDELWLTLTNDGFRERPDLVDSHTVHYHGFPNAASGFDGEPMASFGINIGSSLTYYYKNEEPGTFMWHCHVEAAEHMQMGMLGQIYVNPKQDVTGIPGAPQTLVNGLPTGQVYAYNDCMTPTAIPPSLLPVPPPLVLPAIAADPLCGATRYTSYSYLKPMEITSFDPVFHHFDQTYQKVRFDLMNDTYAMFNGRGYPDTVITTPIINNGTPFDPAHIPSQPHSAVLEQYDGTLNPDGTAHGTTVTVTAGQRILIRMPSLSTVDFYTVTVIGIPIEVVGEGARLLRGPAPAPVLTAATFNPGYGLSTIYRTSSVTIGGGEAYDLILDTTGVPPGTYFMYTTNLNALNNTDDDFGGMMTEIVVN
jgi:FtsP/CotA-like multicopper oxidase with cupredoxin domain